MSRDRVCGSCGGVEHNSEGTCLLILQDRVTSLENQVKLLWEVLLTSPRLDGVENMSFLASERHQVWPDRFD